MLTAKEQILQELETNKQYHLETSRNERLWALGSDSMETSTMHEDNRMRLLEMAGLYDKLIDFLEKN